MDAGTDKAAEPTEEYGDFTLPKETELRLFVPVGTTGVRLRINPQSMRDSHRDAEVFGCPLATGPTTKLVEGSSIGIWSWNGCTVRVLAPERFRARHVFRAASTHHKAVAEYHAAFLHPMREAARAASLASGEPHTGPRVVVCGGRATGRHAVAKTLANYAVRFAAGWAPTVVDLDPNHQMFNVPGTVCAGCWDVGSTVDEGTMHMPAVSFFTGSVHAVEAAPGEQPAADAPLSGTYMQAARNAVRAATARVNHHGTSVVGWSGVIAVAPWVPDVAEATKMVNTIVSELNATHVLVVGDDSLRAALLQRFEATRPPTLPFGGGEFVTAHGTPLSIDGISASSGAVDWGLESLETAARNRELQRYFRGVPDTISLLPVRVQLPFTRIDVVRWIDVGQRPNPQRVAESKYAEVAAKRIGAIMYASEQLHAAPVLRVCHIDAVDPASLALTVCGLLSDDPTVRYTVLVGSVVWLV